MNYKGIIIEESLEDKSVLKSVKILKKKVEVVTPKHKTPWIKTWTMDIVEISENKADLIAEKISGNLDKEHKWYADYKNQKYHYVIFRNKVFKVDLSNPVLYKDTKEYGISIGIPEYQLDFV